MKIKYLFFYFHNCFDSDLFGIRSSSFATTDGDGTLRGGDRQKGRGKRKGNFEGGKRRGGREADGEREREIRETETEK